MIPQQPFHPLQSSLPTSRPTNSFWHREPSSILLGHRTTEYLPTETDVVIVGSGVAGAWAARSVVQSWGGLTSEKDTWMERETEWMGKESDGEKKMKDKEERVEKKDLRVVMVEAREACWGATGRNGGHCQPSIYHNEPHIARFEIANLQNLRSLVVDNLIECDWCDVWCCHGYADESSFASGTDAVERLRVVDPQLAEQVTIVTSQSTDPSLSELGLGDGVVGAITQKLAASLWPYKMVSWILEQLLSSNNAGHSVEGKRSVSFNLQTNTPVMRLQKLESGGWVVHTPRGMIAAKKVLLATNAYTSYLLPKFSDLIVPVRGQMSALIPPSSLRPDAGAPFAGQNSYNFFGPGRYNVSKGDYLIQRPPSSATQESQHGGGGSELMFGGGRQFAANVGVGISDDSAIDEPTASYLRQALTHSLALHSDDEELKASHEWSGVMGFSRDGHPWVGSVPEELGGGEGLWICAGFTGHGMARASLCAKAVAEEMMAEETGGMEVPREFRCSAARAGRAREMVSVEVAEKGNLGLLNSISC